jgi:hypothetical protein
MWLKPREVAMYNEIERYKQAVTMFWLSEPESTGEKYHVYVMGQTRNHLLNSLLLTGMDCQQADDFIYDLTNDICNLLCDKYPAFHGS